MDFKPCFSYDINKETLYHYKPYKDYYLWFDKIEYYYLSKESKPVKKYIFHAYDLNTFAYVENIMLFGSMIEVGIEKNEFFNVVFSSPEEEAKVLLMR